MSDLLNVCMTVNFMLHEKMCLLDVIPVHITLSNQVCTDIGKNTINMQRNYNGNCFKQEIMELT